MKSNEDRPVITFALLQQRLIELVVSRVNNGDFTERGLARVIGVSQPQIHNVLKGKRKLQIALADRIMLKFEISTVDLFYDRELRERLVTRVGMNVCSPDPEVPARKNPSREFVRETVSEDLTG